MRLAIELTRLSRVARELQDCQVLPLSSCELVCDKVFRRERERQGLRGTMNPGTNSHGRIIYFAYIPWL